MSLSSKSEFAPRLGQHAEGAVGMEHSSDAFCVLLVSAIERTPQSAAAQALQAWRRTVQDREAPRSKTESRRVAEHPRSKRRAKVAIPTCGPSIPVDRAALDGAASQSWRSAQGTSEAVDSICHSAL